MRKYISFDLLHILYYYSNLYVNYIFVGIVGMPIVRVLKSTKSVGVG